MEGTRFLSSDQVEGEATGTTAKAGLTVGGSVGRGLRRYGTWRECDLSLKRRRGAEVSDLICLQTPSPP